MCYNVLTMDILYKNSNLILKNVQDFNLSHIFDCGQCFRFNKTGNNTYTGVAKGKALTISQSDDEVVFFNTTEQEFYDVWYDYFDLGTDYTKIKNKLSSDDVMKNAIKYGDGIRILKQDLWETVISFIISASNNIPRIKGIVERLCKNFGDEINYIDNVYYTFPSVQKLSSLTLDDISVIRAGFRDKYILDAAKRFANGTICDTMFYDLSTIDAKKELMQICGVGNKVSDCILLFGLSRADSFPVDVWIKRIMEYCYFKNQPQTKEYISEFAENKFGSLSGYAQQYLFFYARENKIGTD